MGLLLEEVVEAEVGFWQLFKLVEAIKILKIMIWILNYAGRLKNVFNYFQIEYKFYANFMYAG